MARLMKGYEVEWCAGCPVKDGETDLDNADMRIADFANIGLARSYAKRVLPKAFFGVVTINEFELQPYERGYPGLTKEYVGKPEYVE